MNGAFIPLQKGAWHLREFWCKIPAYPGLFVHAEKPGKKPRKARSGWALEKPGKPREYFPRFPGFFLCAKKPGKAKKARSSDLFVALWAFPVFFFWKGPGQLVFLDLILNNICFIIKHFIVMHSKLVLFFSQ